MAQWEKFDYIFSFNKKYSYDSKTVDQIISNRRSLEGQLFADRLLGLLGIKGGTLFFCSLVYSRFNFIFLGIPWLIIYLSTVTKVYPPKSNADLRSLVDHIVASELDIHHKQALVYYLLKDCRNALGAAADFASSCHLPEKYRLFIEGIWHMDRLDFRVCLPV